MTLTSAPKRRFRITIRVSADERRALDRAAERSGLRLSGYARAALLGAKPFRAARRPRIDSALVARVLVQLGVIASALNSISAAAARASLMPFVERELARTLNELRSCRSRLMKALGRKIRSA